MVRNTLRTLCLAIPCCLLLCFATFTMSGCDDAQLAATNVPTISATDAPAAGDATDLGSSDFSQWNVGRKVLVFTTNDCPACHDAMPAVIKLREQLRSERIGVVEINASEHPEIAAKFGVDRYPTYVLSQDGEMRAWTDTLKKLLKLLKIVFKVASFFLL